MLTRATRIPRAGAGELIFTVALEDAPPVTVVGVKLSVDSVGASTVSVPKAELEPNAALTATATLDDTGFVLAKNVPVVDPLGTVTETGTTTLAFGEVRVTLTPLPPALAERRTVPIELSPPPTLAGLNDNLVTD